MDPENKSLNFIFPTRYVIPKSLKFSHWPSKIFIGCLVKTTISNAIFFGVIQVKQIKHKSGCLEFRVFPKMGVGPQNGWFRMEHPIRIRMIWGYPYFWKHPLSGFDPFFFGGGGLAFFQHSACGLVKRQRCLLLQKLTMEEDQRARLWRGGLLPWKLTTRTQSYRGLEDDVSIFESGDCQVPYILVFRGFHNQNGAFPSNISDLSAMNNNPFISLCQNLTSWVDPRKKSSDLFDQFIFSRISIAPTKVEKFDHSPCGK